VLATAALSLVLVAGAPAATINGTAGPDRLNGTGSADSILGREGDDRLFGRAGDDFLLGGTGSDLVVGDDGWDRISVHADGADTVRCGGGRDIVTTDGSDRVGADCEVVSRQLSRDPVRTFRAQHQTQVEPDSFAFGSTIVTAFQSGRFVDGGAANIGFATSRNAGRSWRSGFLPALTAHSRPAGPSEFATDPVVAYDAAHGRWLIASLAVTQNADRFLVSRSRDGVSWDRPIVAAEAVGQELAYDKEWLACDNGRMSRLRGTCYLAYLDSRRSGIDVRRSRDGGLTWSPPVAAVTDTRTSTHNGAFPVIRPDGTLVVLFIRFGYAFTEDVLAVSSNDGGVSFSPQHRVAPVGDPTIRGMRAPTLPSAEVDAAGTIYVSWHDCQLQEDCATSDVLLASSRDGVSWSAVRRVPTGGGVEVDYFTPGIAVDPSSSGPRGRLAITYHSLRQCSQYVCPGIDGYLVTSEDGGDTWSAPQRLTSQPMSLLWVADSHLGRMLADYISTSYVGGRPMPVFVIASPPVGEEFRQSTFAMTRGTPLPRTARRR